MNKVMKTCFASVVSELQQSDLYMTVKARLFETPKANLNGARVTPAFLNEIVENEDKYVGLPLVADVKSLANGHYEHLGHLYDARTGQFYTTQIGSFYKFEREDFEGGSYLVGYARVMKRNKAVCRAIAELFADNALKFSFEISCGNYEELDDGTISIDVGENNFLEGAAIVTFPACEDAVALELVAECDRIADDIRKGDNNMTDVNEPVEQVAETVEDTQETVDVQAECKTKEEDDSENQTAETTYDTEKEEDVETAAVHTWQVHEEKDSINAYDDETGVEIHEETIRTTSVSSRVDDVSLIAEEEDSSPTEPDSETSHQNAEAEQQENDEVAQKIAELTNIVAELQNEIAEMKRQAEEAKTHSAENTVNPFMAEINMRPKYSLLEKVSPVETYSLLEKA